MNKKYSVFKIAVIMLVSCALLSNNYMIKMMPVSAEGTATLLYESDKTIVNPGGTFTITVKIKDILPTEDIAGVGIKLKYDSRIVSPIDVPYIVFDPVFASGYIDSGTYSSQISGEQGIYRYIYGEYFYSGAPVTGASEYTFATISFRLSAAATSQDVLQLFDYSAEPSEITSYGGGTFPPYSLTIEQTTISGEISIADITPRILNNPTEREVLTNGDTFFAPVKPYVAELPNVTYTYTLDDITNGIRSGIYNSTEYATLSVFANGRYMLSVTAVNNDNPAQTSTVTISFMVEEFDGTLQIALVPVTAEVMERNQLYADISLLGIPSSLMAGTPAFNFTVSYDPALYAGVTFANTVPNCQVIEHNDPTDGQITINYIMDSLTGMDNLREETSLGTLVFTHNQNIPRENFGDTGEIPTTITTENIEIARHSTNINPSPGFYTSIGMTANTKVLQEDVEPPIVAPAEATAWTNVNRDMYATIIDLLSGLDYATAKSGVLDDTTYAAAAGGIPLTATGGDNEFMFTTDVAIGESVRSYTIMAIDDVGNASYTPIRVLVDRNAPVANVAAAIFNPTSAIKGPITVTIPVSDGGSADNSGIDAVSFIWKRANHATVEDFESDNTSLSGYAPFDGTDAVITAPTNGFYTMLVIDSVGNKAVYTVEVTQIFPITVATLLGNAAPVISIDYGPMFADDDPVFDNVTNKINGSFKQMRLSWTEAAGYTTSVDLSTDNGLTWTPYAKETYIDTIGVYIARITTTKDDNPVLTDYKDYRFNIVAVADIPTINADRLWTLSDVNIFRENLNIGSNKTDVFSGGYFAGNVTGDFLYSDNNAVDFGLILKRHKESLNPVDIFDIYK